MVSRSVGFPGYETYSVNHCANITGFYLFMHPFFTLCSNVAKSLCCATGVSNHNLGVLTATIKQSLIHVYFLILLLRHINK